MDALFIASIELCNWLRYRGKHVIALVPTVYGVTATLTDDAERSNWLGKSAFLATMRFVLFGKRPENARTRAGQFTEDGWITWDEKEGHVAFVLNDGTRIERSRVIGKSTQLKVTTSDGAELGGDGAQEYVRGLVGLDLKDLDASCFVAQKKMAHFVTCKASERYATIFGWMRLEKVQAAASRVGAELVKLQTDRDERGTKITVAKASIESILKRYFDDVEGANLDDAGRELEALRVELVAVRDAAKEGLQAARAAIADMKAWQADAANAASRAEWIAEADKLEASFDKAAGEKLEADIEAAKGVVNAVYATKITATQECGVKAKLATGSFGGVCPVDGHACPDRATMNQAREANAALLATARAAADAANAAYDKAATDLRELERKRAAILQVCVRVADLRSKAEELEEAAATIAKRGKPPEIDPTKEDPMSVAETQADEKLRNAEVEVREIERLIGEFKGNRAILGALEQANAELDRKIRIRRQAFAILGRNGVQRRFAERARVAIESGANTLLEANATDLRVHLAWEREAGGLAVQCDECGSPFPTSLKIKECGRCGAPRGPKTVDELRCELTNRSGAADDLAGGAVQLAAAAWLRGERRARWSVAFIDEPFGALDTHNRKAFAVHLTAMLRSRYGFAQAFVVAHEPGIMDSLPGRIAITATEDRSSVAVV